MSLPGRGRARIDWAAYLYIAPAFGLALIFSFFSMGVSFWTSLHQWDPFAGGGRYIGLDNYRRVLWGVDSLFWVALRNTSLYVVMVLVGMLATSLPLALLCRKAKTLQGLFRTLYFLPSITPGVVVALIFYQIFGVFGQPLDRSETALGALALMGVWSGAGYDMLIFLAGLNEIPTDFYEAARLDGANALQEFWHVTIPLLRNTLVFVIVMRCTVSRFLTGDRRIRIPSSLGSIRFTTRRSSRFFSSDVRVSDRRIFSTSARA
jgi:multiple sugar transport system permease protein